MKINIGAGNRPIIGFINTDLFPSDSKWILKAGADNLYFAGNASTELIFSNAVFEHFSENEYDNIFREWKRILRGDGAVICLGIPDFNQLTWLYRDGEIDLSSVYRYLIGEFTNCESIDEFKSQMHKRLFNAFVLRDIFEGYGFQCQVFRYCYPNESLSVNLGVVASGYMTSDMIEWLNKIPSINDYIDIETVNELL